jgi:hypothetical protein
MAAKCSRRFKSARAAADAGFLVPVETVAELP